MSGRAAAVGDEAGIIFGAVNEPAMQGEIRVTVIATGFDRQIEGTLGGSAIRAVPAAPAAMGQRNVIPITQRTPARTVAAPAPRVAAPAVEGSRRVIPPSAQPQRPETELTDMDIPTFIRRQMD